MVCGDDLAEKERMGGVGFGNEGATEAADEGSGGRGGFGGSGVEKVGGEEREKREKRDRAKWGAGEEVSIVRLHTYVCTSIPNCICPSHAFHALLSSLGEIIVSTWSQAWHILRFNMVRA